MTIHQDITCLSYINVLGNVIIEGDVTIGSNIIVQNDVIINGDVRATNITSNTIEVIEISTTNTINVIEDILVNNNITVLGTFTVSGNSIINNNCTVNNNVYVNGDIICENNMSIGNNLYVSGNSIITNNFTVGNTMLVQYNSIIDNILTVLSNLNVENSTIVNNNMTIIGDLFGKDDCNIEGNLVVTNTSSIVRILGHMFSNLENYDDNDAAIAAGVPNWGLYRTGGIIKIRWDNEPPLVTINGDNPVIVYSGEKVIEPGVFAYDTIDGDVDVFIDSIKNNITKINILNSQIPVSEGPIITDVNNLNIGNYTVTYYAYDEAGNIGINTRIITIPEYITFYPFIIDWTVLLKIMEVKVKNLNII